MLWHCGLLDPAQGENFTLSRIRRQFWHSLPPEVEYELGIWLAMPGFSNRYHAEALHQDQRLIARRVGGFEEHKSEVLANWLSASREDCIRLCYLRPNKGNVPLLSQLQMRRDFCRGMPQHKIANEFMVTRSLVNQLCWDLPERLIEGAPLEIREVIFEDSTINPPVSSPVWRKYTATLLANCSTGEKPHKILPYSIL